MSQKGNDRAPPAEEPSDAAIQSVSDWLIEQGLVGGLFADLIASLGQRLNSAGLPVDRLHVSLAALHPNYGAFGTTWTRGANSAEDRYLHGAETGDTWRQSPLKAMLDKNTPRKRQRLEDPNAGAEFPVFAELSDAGATDWLAHVVRFGNPGLSINLPGMLASWVTERPGGFRDAELAALDRIAPRLALACYRISLERVAGDLLDAYVGRDAGHRILGGQVQRGTTETISAALLFADLRGFTAAADRTDGKLLIDCLNDYLGSATEAIMAEGGEVLKFLGDGLLAIFPLEDGAADPGPACDRALAAARAALTANQNLCSDFAEKTLPSLALDIALHCGEVLYGNIGAAERLDFTVIGPAVNEASRIEALCEPLGQALVISAAFAGHSTGPFRSLGSHSLRGVGEPQELFTLS